MCSVLSFTLSVAAVRRRQNNDKAYSSNTRAKNKMTVRVTEREGRKGRRRNMMAESSGRRRKHDRAHVACTLVLSLSLFLARVSSLFSMQEAVKAPVCNAKREAGKERKRERGEHARRSGLIHREEPNVHAREECGQ